MSEILAGDLVWFRPQVMVSRGFSNPGDPMDLVNRDFTVYKRIVAPTESLSVYGKMYE